MTLPNSGAISINSLVGEYGGSAPHSMSEYYKGGGLVANHSNNPNVPTSGTISLSNFYGASNTPPSVNTWSSTISCGSTTFIKNTYNGFFIDTSLGQLISTAGSRSPTAISGLAGNPGTPMNGASLVQCYPLGSISSVQFTGHYPPQNAPGLIQSFNFNGTNVGATSGNQCNLQLTGGPAFPTLSQWSFATNSAGSLPSSGNFSFTVSF